MLQRVSNDLDEPVSIFLHSGQLYYHVGAHHDRALEQFSIVTRSEGKMAAGVETTQAFIFDPDYVRTTIECKGRPERKKGLGWMIVELEREVKSEAMMEETGGRAFGLSQVAWTRITRGPWKASEEKEWKHTLDVLRRNHDEKLIVTPSHEQVVEHLKEEEDISIIRPAYPDFSYIAPRSSESSDRPKKRKVSEEITWENDDEKNIKILALEFGLKEEEITTFASSPLAPLQRSYRSTVDGELLASVLRPPDPEKMEMARRTIEKELGVITNSVPCHPEQQSSTVDPCTAVQSEAGAHQSSPLLE